MKLTTPLTVLLFLSLSLFSQEDTIKKKKNIITTGFAVDSIEELIRFAAHDSNRVNLYYTLSRQYEYFHSKERIDFLAIALSYAKKSDDKVQIRKISSDLITTLYDRKMYDIAMTYCMDYMSFLEEEGAKDEIPQTYKIYATLLSKKGNYRDASQYYHLAKNYYLSKNDMNAYAGTLKGLSSMLKETGRADSALLYSMRVVDIFQRQNSSSNLSNSVLEIAEIYLIKKDILNAKRKANEAYELYSSSDKDERGMAASLLLLGNIYTKDNKADSALAAFRSASVKIDQLNFMNLKRDCSEGLAKAYALAKNFEEAYKQEMLFKKYSDTISLSNLNGSMLEMAVKYDINAKQSEMKEKDAETVAESGFKNYWIAIVALALASLFMTFRSILLGKKIKAFTTSQKNNVQEKSLEIKDISQQDQNADLAIKRSEIYSGQKQHEPDPKK